MIVKIKPHILVVEIPRNATKIKLSIINKNKFLTHDEVFDIKLPKGEYEIVGVYKLYEQDYIYTVENKDLQVPLFTPDELKLNGCILSNENKYIILKANN